MRVCSKVGYASGVTRGLGLLAAFVLVFMVACTCVSHAQLAAGPWPAVDYDNARTLCNDMVSAPNMEPDGRWASIGYQYYEDTGTLYPPV